MFRGRAPKNTSTMMLEQDPGAGNLSARAHMAAVIGPFRIASGKQSTLSLNESKGLLLAQNGVRTAESFAFVSVVLAGNVAGPKRAIFGNNQTFGFNDGIPLLLERSTGEGNSFSAVLAPGEELYGRSVTGQGTYNVVVSVVWF